MNLKPINDVPEIESLQEGDKILVNSNGLAKQIAAEKVGGSGGGVGTIYGVLQSIDEVSGMLIAYADREMTQPMTYAEGKAMVESGMRLCVDVTGLENPIWMYLFPVAMLNDEGKTVTAMIYVGELSAEVAIVFTDSTALPGEEG